MKESKSKRIFFYLLSLLSLFLIASPIFFLQNQELSGAFGLVGLLTFMTLNRLAEEKEELIFLYLSFLLSFMVRFCRLLGDDEILVSLLFALSYSAILVIFLALARWVCKTRTRWLSPFIFPAGYTLLNIVLAASRLGNIYNLVNYLCLIPLLAFNLGWASEFGFTFLFLLFYSSLLECFFDLKRKQRVFHGGLSFALIASLLIGGILSRPKKNESSYNLHIALGLSQKYDENAEYNVDEICSIFEKEVKEASEENADLLFLHEEFISFYANEEEDYLSYFSSVLKQYHIPALICVEEIPEDNLGKNKAFYFDGDGELASSYQKANLVPVIESSSYESGTWEPAYLETTLGGHSVNITYMICFDINNDFFIHQVKDSTELLLVASWDWNNCNLEQRRTYMRSMECNTTLVKHTYDGFSYVSTPTGLYGEMIDNRNRYETISMVEIPIYKK